MSRIGPFELLEPVGQGGMGRIWRAVHHAQRVPAAVKVMLDRCDDPAFRDGFLQEVELVAGLDHPNVVMVFDAGLLPAPVVAPDGSHLPEGAPFLVMELASGGALATPSSWPELRHIFVSTLDGLAHAHARGIVHRDIKPANLLMAGSRADLASKPADLLGSRIVLSDFGIGLKEEEASAQAAMGTPKYMAPEQILHDWRELGPWTDLYSLGVVVWLATTGQTPFHARDSRTLLMQHLQKPPPRFVPRFPVPDGFEPLVRRLLAKSPADRFASAADVRRAVEELASVGGGGAASAVVSSDDPTVTLGDRTRAAEAAGVTASASLPAAQPDRAAYRPLPRARADHRDFRLVGAGLGLYGLRPLPVVGRAEEQQVLLRAYEAVRRSRSPRAVVLRGTLGVGKSRLARWLEEHLLEDGAALSITATHGGDAEHGIARAVARFLRTDGLDAPNVLRRVRAALGPSATAGVDRTLAALLVPGASKPPRAERVVALLALLEALSASRPVLLRLEDVHLAPTVLGLLRRLLRSGRGRVLAVVTVQEEGLREEDAPLVDALDDLEGVEVLRVGLLGDDAQRELVRRLLGLEGTLADRVQRRTRGNPLFATQLVGHWVASGLLVPGPRGFRLAEGASPELPDSMLAVWTDRVEALARGRSGDDRLALEVAAVLGVEVRLAEWRSACAAGGLRPASDLVDVLLRERLAVRSDPDHRALAFVHGGLRETLLQQSRASGRWPQLNAWCADVLLALPSTDPARLARHLLAAGRHREALEPLDQAVCAQLSGRDTRSEALLQEYDAAVAASALPESDERRGWLRLRWAWLYRLRGDAEAAIRAASEAEALARSHGWLRVRARALGIQARAAILAGEVQAATDHVLQAVQVARQARDQVLLADLLTTVGDVLLTRGDHEGATDAYTEAAGVLDATEGLGLSVAPWLGLARLEQQRGRFDDAARALERAREAADRENSLGDRAEVANLQGEVARKRGDLATAEEAYRRAVDLYRSLEHGYAVIGDLNLGLVLVARQRWDDAATLVGQLMAEVGSTGSSELLLHFARSILLPCLCASGRWQQAEQVLEALEAFVARTGQVEADVADLARRAGELAARSNPVVARRALRLAHDQYLGLGRDEDARRCR